MAAVRSVRAGGLRPAFGQAIRPAAAALPVHGAGAEFEGPACPVGFQAAVRSDGLVLPVGRPEVRRASAYDPAVVADNAPTRSSLPASRGMMLDIELKRGGVSA